MLRASSIHTLLYLFNLMLMRRFLSAQIIFLKCSSQKQKGADVNGGMGRRPHLEFWERLLKATLSLMYFGETFHIAMRADPCCLWRLDLPVTV